MSKDNYSLKKVYKSVLKLTKENYQSYIIKEFDASSVTNSKKLKDLYSKYNISAGNYNFINQTASTEIPGLGTFDLTPVQIGLIGCIDQYCYSDDTLALNLINILKNGVVSESADKDSSKLKSPKGFKLNYEYAMMFLDECKINNILDKNYKIKEGMTISQSEYQISEANGFLFELFLCYNIVDFFGGDKIDIKNVVRLSSYKNVSYISTILSVIYNLVSYDQAINKYMSTDYKYLYDNIFNKKDNILQTLIDEKINYNDLFFDFKKGGAPIDLYVRKNSIDGEIISAIDIKTSLVGRQKNAISTNHESLNSQINEIIIENKQKGSIKDFNICLFSLQCTYNKNNFTIDNKSCKYISFIEQYHNVYERILKNQTREFSFTEDDNYLTIEDLNKRPITLNLLDISYELIQKSIDIAKKSGFSETEIKQKIVYFLFLINKKTEDILAKEGRKTLSFNSRKAMGDVIRVNLGSGANTVSNDGKYISKRISKLGQFFKENPKYVEILYQNLYEYVQAEFEKDPESVEFYYNLLSLFTAQAQKLIENLQEKELVAKDQKQKSLLLQFVDSKHKRPRVFSNEEAIDKLVAGINKVISGVISNQSTGYQNGQLKFLIGSGKKCGYVGEHFKQNPSDLMKVYQIIFEQFSNQTDLNENYKYYKNILNKVYNNIIIVVENFNAGKEQSEKIDLSSFNKINLNKNESVLLSNKRLLREVYKLLF